MTVTEKVAYLRGLCEGMAVDESTNVGKLIKEIINVLEDMAYSIADVEDGLDEVSEEIEAIDEDLEELEQTLYGEDGEEDEEEDDEEDDDEIYEVTCPSCSEKICMDYDMLCDGEIECPNCGEHLEFEMDGCGCADGECECSDCDACEEAAEEEKGGQN